MNTMQAMLCRSSESNDPEKVYLCRSGTRYLVTEADRVNMYGLHWPTDVIDVPQSFIEKMRPGQILPKKYLSHDISNLNNGFNSRDMRELAASQLFGTGVELGALASPFPVPIDCNVIYADILSYKELIVQYPNEPLDSLVIPTLKTKFDSLDAINDESMDFFVASHVIEHTNNPIKSIEIIYKKLRDGGSLVMVVPDKNRTFDKKRNLTSLEHLIQDYIDPSNERDAVHYKEFFKYCFPSPEERYESDWKSAWVDKVPIHYHTWEYVSFKNMIGWIIKNVAPFKVVWSHPTLTDEKMDFEFYFTLVK